MDAIVPCYSLEGLDTATAKLIVELQLEDIRALKENSKGKLPEGSISDADLALTLLEGNLQNTQTIVSDRRMTESIVDAIEQDDTVIREAAVEEERAHTDRQFALRLDGTNANRPVEPDTKHKPGVQDTSIDVKVLAKLAGAYLSESLGEELHNSIEGKSDSTPHDAVGREIAESSANGERRETAAPTRTGHCVACAQDKRFFEVIEAPCQHEYCKECLQELFRLATTDESQTAQARL